MSYRTTAPGTKPTNLYPPLEPYDSGFLPVSKIHTIYYEQSGNKDSKNAVIFLHGGPGGGTDPSNRQFFDPVAYRIVLFDQRGCGKSTPFACLEENTTQDLAKDIETLRTKLNIDKWVVFGGSWGSTLALYYAENYPERVKALVLRGIFLIRHKELHWFYQEGASFIFPEAWDKYLDPIPENERGDLMKAYHKRLTGDNHEERLKCGKAWTTWELSTSKLFVDEEFVKKAEGEFSDAFARIESHYFVNKAFLKENELIDNAHKLENIPTVIVQGRYDVVCPSVSAWELKKAWKGDKLKYVVVPDSGHSAKEPGITYELVKACDEFKTL